MWQRDQYGNHTRHSRVHRADAKTLAGFTAGLLASLGYLLFATQVTDIPLGIIIGIMCPLTGLIYVSLVPTFLRSCGNLLPPVGGGVLVGIGVAVFLTLCNFIMVHSIDIDSTVTFHDLIHHVQDLLPQAMAGGLIGGGLAGIVSSMFFEKWQDL